MLIEDFCRSQWPRGLKCGSAPTRLLELWLRIPPEAWMSVVSCECFMLSGRGLCVGMFTRPEESYWGRCVWTWLWSLNNEEACAHWWLLCHRKRQNMPMQFFVPWCVLRVSDLNNTFLETCLNSEMITFSRGRYVLYWATFCTVFCIEALLPFTYFTHSLRT
jgi:hypothetical protein